MVVNKVSLEVSGRRSRGLGFLDFFFRKKLVKKKILPGLTFEFWVVVEIWDIPSSDMSANSF